VQDYADDPKLKPFAELADKQHRRSRKAKLEAALLEASGVMSTSSVVDVLLATFSSMEAKHPHNLANLTEDLRQRLHAGEANTRIHTQWLQSLLNTLGGVAEQLGHFVVCRICAAVSTTPRWLAFVREHFTIGRKGS
jgi:hypothetical protein